MRARSIARTEGKDWMRTSILVLAIATIACSSPRFWEGSRGSSTPSVAPPEPRPSAPPSRTDGASEMKAEVVRLRERIDRLERRVEAAEGQSPYAPSAYDYTFRRAVESVVEDCDPECRISCRGSGDDVDCEASCDVGC